MSPIEQIANGIREGDWQSICEGYEKLTGEWIAPPEVAVTVDDAQIALKKIVDIASTALDTSTTTHEAPNPVSTTTKERTKNKAGRKKGTKNKKTFKTTKVDKGGDDDSLEFDTSKITPIQRDVGGTRLITNEPDPGETERNRVKAEKANRNKIKLKRKAIKTHKVKCNECEATFESNRIGGEVGQKCPKCLKHNKSRFV